MIYLKHYCVGYAKARVSTVWLGNTNAQRLRVHCTCFVEFEVLSEVTLQIMVYWAMTPHSLVHDTKPLEESASLQKAVLSTCPSQLGFHRFWYVQYFITQFKIIVHTSFQTFTLKLLVLKSRKAYPSVEYKSFPSALLVILHCSLSLFPL